MTGLAQHDGVLGCVWGCCWREFIAVLFVTAAAESILRPNPAFSNNIESLRIMGCALGSW